MFYEWMYYFHVVGFLAAACVAFVLGFMRPQGKLRSICIGNAIPLLVSSLTYLMVRSNQDQPEIRWLGYTVACSFFAYETARTLKRSPERALFAGIFMGLTLFTGFGTYFAHGTLDKVGTIVIGSVAYVFSLWFIILDDERKLPMGIVPKIYLALFVVVWSAYPFFFGFGPAFWDLYDQDWESLAYFILEFPAKYGVAMVNILFALNWSAAKNRIVASYRKPDEEL